jgi:hypothetical protein
MNILILIFLPANSRSVGFYAAQGSEISDEIHNSKASGWPENVSRELTMLSMERLEKAIASKSRLQHSLTNTEERAEMSLCIENAA